LVKQLKNYKGNYLLVKGLPGTLDNSISHSINHLSAENLVKEINSSEMVICRSGYSSVMDLIKLQKKAIFIPTPGQTEQEYLAKKLFEDNLFLYAKQQQFNLEEMLEKAKQFPFKKLDLNFEQFKSTVNGALSYEL
jgi:predicted glycosyltransferase